MIWLEVISVRTSTYEETMTALDRCRSIQRCCSTGQPLDLRVYCSASYESDLSVHIRWDAGGGRHGKSPLGMELNSAFSSLGLVNHTVWMEVLPGGTDAPVRPWHLM